MLMLNSRYAIKRRYNLTNTSIKSVQIKIYFNLFMSKLNLHVNLFSFYHTFSFCIQN